MLERIRLRTEPTCGDVNMTRAKYAGLLTGQIAVMRLRLNEAIAENRLAEAADLRETIVDLQERLSVVRRRSPSSLTAPTAGRSAGTGATQEA